MDSMAFQLLAAGFTGDVGYKKPASRPAFRLTGPGARPGIPSGARKTLSPIPGLRDNPRYVPPDPGVWDRNIEVTTLQSSRRAPMPDKKIIAVMGATGAQGGGLARAILADRQSTFTVRAITRKPDSE